MGTVRGGVLCDLADAAMGYAYASSLADDETFTTVELKINFLRPVWRGRIYADAQLVSRGWSISVEIPSPDPPESACERTR